MTWYQAEVREERGNRFPWKGQRFTQVRAKTIAEAAQIAGKRLLDRRGVVMFRVTGDPGLSGMFQAYTPIPQRLGGGWNSVGPNIHLWPR